MKKINGAKICNVFSIALLLGFVIKTIVDYFRYSTTLNSAPFYIWIIVNMVYFIIPAIIVFIVGIILKKKTKTDQ